MITHKDSFSGFCGKTKKLENPKMYTTPSTVQQTADYTNFVMLFVYGHRRRQVLLKLSCALYAFPVI